MNEEVEPTEQTPAEIIEETKMMSSPPGTNIDHYSGACVPDSFSD